MKKRIVALVLSLIMIFSVSISFAAVDNGSVYNQDGTLFATGNEMNMKEAKRNQVNTQSSQFLYGFDGKLYIMDDAQAAYLEAETDMDVFANLIVTKDEEVIEKLKVVEVIAINKTEVTVKLSKEATEVLTKDFFTVTGATLVSVKPGATPDVYLLAVESLDGKAGTVTVNGKSLDYNFVPVVPTTAAVEDIEFVNYRQIKVTFNKVVDKATAEWLPNYYFHIVEGDASQLGALQIDDSNSFYQVELATAATPAKGADTLATDLGVEISSEVNELGKTVVTINFPEDGRFTNVLDQLTTTSLPIAGTDDERTIEVSTADLGGGIDFVPLIKETNVAIAVRNVTKDDKYKIDTFVKDILIRDTDAPELEKVYKNETVDGVKVSKEVPKTDLISTKFIDIETNLDGVVIDRTLNIITKNLTPVLNTRREVMTFEYDEPVFDAHDTDSKVKVYVNNVLVAETGKAVNTLSYELAANNANTQMNTFDNVINFKQDAAVTYDEARNADFNVFYAIQNYVIQKAQTDVTTLMADLINALDQAYAINKTYNIRIVGVTDLAGNIQTPSTINFQVNLIETPVSGGTTTTNVPVVEKIQQKADNVIRVWTTKPANFDLFIENADGDHGKLEVTGQATVTPDGDLFYTDVYFAATDARDELLTNDVLEYDEQNEIYRDVLIRNVVDSGDPSILGNSKLFKTFEMVKDDLAPKARTYAGIEIDVSGIPTYREVSDIADYKLLSEEDRIIIPVYDLLPESWKDGNGGVIKNMQNQVRALEYAFAAGEFTNNVDLTSGDYLPIRVSYLKNGATHTALVSNQPTLINNIGIAGSIDFDDMDINGDGVMERVLVIDLNPGDNDDMSTVVPATPDAYATLLNDEGKLVEDVKYTIEIPKGYFADTSLDIIMDTDVIVPPMHPNFIDATSAADDVLHVHVGRNADYGFTSKAHVVVLEVPKKAEAEESEYWGVPQTSKELIKYNDARNEITVEFTGKIDIDTLLDTDNYILNGQPLSTYEVDANTITYVIDNKGTIDDVTDDQIFAVIKVPQNSIAANGFVPFEVKNVANPDGGKMTPVATKINLLDNTQPTALIARMKGNSEIEIVFDEPIMAKADATLLALVNNFNIYIDGHKDKVTDVQIDTNIITIKTLGSFTLQQVEAGLIRIEMVLDQNDDMLIHDLSPNKNPLRDGVTMSVVR